MLRSNKLSATIMVILLGLALNLICTQSAYAQSSADKVASRDVFALASDNTIHQLSFTTNGFKGAKSIKRTIINGVSGTLIGIDFRVTGPGTFQLYGLSDNGNIYSITLPSGTILGVGTATLVSTLSTNFGGGFQSLLDFNPVLNAIRLVGSNDQNVAVVNSNGGNLNASVAQTAFSYVTGDPKFGVDPNITGGSYTNNVSGATQTYFFTIDYNQDTLVTIADLNSTGSSNTGGGKLKTVGAIIDTAGNPINFTPTADMDIFTDTTFGNQALVVNGRNAYLIDLSTVNPLLPVGTTQTVVASPIEIAQSFTHSPEQVPYDFIDVAVTPSPVRAGTIADLAIGAGGSLPNFASYPSIFFSYLSGQSLNYSVFVENHGTETVTNVKLIGSSTFSNLSVTPSQGTCTLTPDALGTNCTCNLGTIAKGAVVKLNVSGSNLVSLFNGTGADAFTVSGSADPNEENNSVSIRVFKVTK